MPNFFSEDALLRDWVKRSFSAKALPKTVERLEAFGELCGHVLPPLIDEAHREDNLPKLARYDRWGERIDQIRYSPQQVQARKLVLEAGVLPPVPFKERMIKAYLLNQNGEGGVTCPLAMTDGLAGLLNEWGAPDQKKRYLPLLDDSSVETPLTGGQFVTEKQSGSNVSENETRAVRAADGSWRLTGLKWFCSNPGELWVTTAKVEGTNMVALFLMPRRLPDGTLNDCHILRLKEICGTRGKATAEVEYKGAYAELIGKPRYGIAILLDTVLKTSRVHVAAGSLGMMRRALVEAQDYAKNRKAIGRPIAQLPHVASSLKRMEERWASCFRAFAEEIDLIEAEDPAADILIPLLKIHIASAATDQVREAQMILAGQGILFDFSILPRLSQDALVQEIWEGTHGVLAGHAVKALRRPAPRASFEKLLDACEKRAQGRSGLKPALFALKEERKHLSTVIPAKAGIQESEAELDSGLRRNDGLQPLDVCRSAFAALTLGLTLRDAG